MTHEQNAHLKSLQKQLSTLLAGLGEARAVEACNAAGVQPLTRQQAVRATVAQKIDNAEAVVAALRAKAIGQGVNPETGVDAFAGL